MQIPHPYKGSGWQRPGIFVPGAAGVCRPAVRRSSRTYRDMIGCGVPTILSFAPVITLISSRDAPSFELLFTKP